MTETLQPFVGEWTLTPDFPNAPPAGTGGRVTYEWMGPFLLQRWEVPVPEAPDGVAVITPRRDGDGHLQHYFDNRGVARVYEMTFDGRVWTLERTKPDLSPLDFAQRYVGTFDDDATEIRGAWEIRHPGEDWRLDFGLNYTRVTRP
jgi:hypothetical protein